MRLAEHPCTANNTDKIWHWSIPKIRPIPNIFKAYKPSNRILTTKNIPKSGIIRDKEQSDFARQKWSPENYADRYFNMLDATRPTDKYYDILTERVDGRFDGVTDNMLVLKSSGTSVIDADISKADIESTGSGEARDCVKRYAECVTHGAPAPNVSEFFPEIIFSFFSTRDRSKVDVSTLSHNNALYENNEINKALKIEPCGFQPIKNPKMELQYASTQMSLDGNNDIILNRNDVHKSEVKFFINNSKTDELFPQQEVSYECPKSLLYTDACDHKNNLYNEIVYSTKTNSSNGTFNIDHNDELISDNGFRVELVSNSKNVANDESCQKYATSNDQLSVSNKSVDSAEVADYFIEKPTSEYEKFDYYQQSPVGEISTISRRATLLRNDMIPFYSVQKRLRNKKVHLTRAWGDIKGWIGSEKVKISRIIKKHAAKQRLHSFDNQTCTSSEYEQPKSSSSTEQGSDQYINMSSSRCDRSFSEQGESQSEFENENLKENYFQSDELKSTISLLTESTICVHKEPLLEISDPILIKINCEHIENLDSTEFKEFNSHDNACSMSAQCCDNTKLEKNQKFCDGNENDCQSVSDFSLMDNSFLKNGVFFLAPHYEFGQNGFEELRRYVKQGGDFCKELSTILQERSDAELQYAKSLSKLGSKLSKICRVNVGSCTETWRHISQEMEQQAEIHRQYSNNLAETISKPLKQMTDSQHKLRKQVESNVDKTSRCLNEWRTAEAKAKKQSHAAARENEKLQDPMADTRMVRSPSLAYISHTHVVSSIRPDRHSTVTPPSPSNGHTDKDVTKMQLKKRKAEDAVKKADGEYYTLCVRAERARLDWESTILRGASIMEEIEEERLHSLKSTAEGYLKISSSLAPQTAECIQRLTGPIAKADPISDIKAVRGVRGAPSAGSCEQLLPDFYCEHITLAMNRERRKQALMKILQLIKHDVEKERKSKQGLEKLAKAIKENPNFGTDDSQLNVTEKMCHMHSMLTYLEAARYKVTSALCELENMPKSQHPLAAHIQITRDKQGLQQSLLKIPSWLQTDYQMEKSSSPINFGSSYKDATSKRPSATSDKIFLRKHSNLSTSPLPPDSPLDWTDRGDGDGLSNQPDSDFDEFSSQDGSCGDVTDATNIAIASLPVPTINNITSSPEAKRKIIGKCKALYNYTPNLYDELKLTPGDLIDVFEKQEDGWWCGDLNGTIGTFPATYVEEII